MPEYEMSDPLTFGGATGQYVVPSPWHTECEWCIVSVVGFGTLASAATFAVGSKNPNQPTLSTTGTDKFGSVTTSSPDNNNALQSYVGAVTAQAPMVTYSNDSYMPLPSPAFVYLQTTTPSTTELLVTIQFRRSLDRVIPDKPRRPQTHSLPQSHKQHRSMMAGFAAQYPEEGQAYEHMPTPPQDTALHARQLGPTQITHRRVNNGRGQNNG